MQEPRQLILAALFLFLSFKRDVECKQENISLYITGVLDYLLTTSYMYIRNRQSISISFCRSCRCGKGVHANVACFLVHECFPIAVDCHLACMVVHETCLAVPLVKVVLENEASFVCLQVDQLYSSQSERFSCGYFFLDATEHCKVS